MFQSQLHIGEYDKSFRNEGKINQYKLRSTGFKKKEIGNDTKNENGLNLFNINNNTNQSIFQIQGGKQNGSISKN